MKAIINGRLILPDKRGYFKPCAGALNFDALNPQKYCRAPEEKFSQLLEAAHEDDN